MGSVKVVDKVERVGEHSVSTVEYEFSDYQDFISFEKYKEESIRNSVQGIFAGFNTEDFFAEPDAKDESGEPTVVDINVKKKDKPTKH